VCGWGYCDNMLGVLGNTCTWFFVSFLLFSVLFRLCILIHICFRLY